MKHALLILALFATGCTSTQRINVGDTFQIDAYNEAHARTEAAVQIEENNRPRTLRADSTTLGPNTLIVHMRGVEIELPLDRVHFVEVPSGKEDVVSAMAIGAGLGALTGAVAGLASGAPASCDGGCFGPSRRQVSLALGGMGSLAGAIVGGLYGASNTPREIIKFEVAERNAGRVIATHRVQSLEEIRTLHDRVREKRHH